MVSKNDDIVKSKKENQKNDKKRRNHGNELSLITKCNSNYIKRSSDYKRKQRIFKI